MRGLRSSLVFSKAAVLALREGRITGTDSGTFSPSLTKTKTILEPLKRAVLDSLKRHLSSDDSVLLLGFLPALAVQVFL